MADVSIVVSGSNNDPNFVVIDTLDPPRSFVVTSPFSGGCLVDCSVANLGGTSILAAVGNYMGGKVAIYDILNPAKPELIGTFDSELGPEFGHTGIGALSLDGTNLLVGEFNGPNLVLIDVSKPPASSIVSSFNVGDFVTAGGFSAVALKGSSAVASGTFGFGVIDYTPPSSPSMAPYKPDAGNGNITFQGPVTCDFDGSAAAFGDFTGNVYLFTIADGLVPNFIGQSPSGLGSVTSIAVKGDVVAAGFILNANVSRIDFENPLSPAVSTALVGAESGFQPGGALKFSAEMPGTFGAFLLAAGVDNGSGVATLNLSQPIDPSVPVTTVSYPALKTASLFTLGFTFFTIGGGG